MSADSTDSNYHAGFAGARNTAILEQLKVSVEDFNGMMEIAGGKSKIEKASSIGAYKRQVGDILEQSFKSDSEISRVLNQNFQKFIQF